MQYQALYRKYRPQRFDEVVGQDHVTGTLRKEVIEEKIAHAYLFTGPRGTGKTTTARILAKALNCADLGPDGEPCNRCPSCVAITEGSALDVIELDAASHNKVEDVREIRVNVGTVAAAGGARRVYILDEAHMLSRAAGNALLKTLEEPPEHVVFVLATTEPYKLLDTIRSRAQRFDFHPVGSETLVAHLESIAGSEGFDVDHSGLAAVAAHAGGSVRDAMSLLEQVAALGSGTVTADGVIQALGLADADTFAALAEAIVSQDAPGALQIVSRLASRGADLRRFVADALAYFRGVFLAQYAPNLEEVVDESPETMALWQRRADEMSSTDVLRAIDHFADALADLRQGREERLVVELTLLKLVRPELTTQPDALAARLDRLERRLRAIEQDVATETERGTVSSLAAVPNEPADAEAPFVPAAGSPPPEPDTAPEPTAEAVPSPPPGDLTLDAFEAIWPAVVGRIRADVGPRRHALVKVATPIAVDGTTVVLEVPAHLHFHLEQLQADRELTDHIVDIASGLVGGRIDVRFRSADPGTSDPAAGTSGAEPVRAPDSDELLESGDPDKDPEDLIADMLGGEIVSE